MVLCELSQAGFVSTWIALTSAAIVSLFLMSGTVFYAYYVNPTYEKWTRKTNAKFPKPVDVKNEIIMMVKGLCVGTLCPATALWLANNGDKWGGVSKAYCGAYEGGDSFFGPIGYNIVQFFVLWIVSDFFEFFYHWCGHYFTFLWTYHKPHHRFFNPSPFAVIADEYLDQFVRSSPLLWFPLIAPVNMDVLFGLFAVFFYGYGTYLHWGYEVDKLSAHNPIL